MKHLKKLFAAAVALITAFAVVAPAFAAEITIKDAPEDAEYEVYKIFDATHDGTAVSYTIPDDSALTKAILEGTELFKCTNNGGKTYVEAKQGASESAIVAWMKANVSTYGIKVTTASYDAETGKITGIADGYYYVKSNINDGKVVMIGSAADSVTINEKNTEPGWGEEGGKTVGDDTYYVGDYIPYTITYTQAMNYDASEGTTKKVYQYVVKDDMPDGVDLVIDDEHPMTVKVGTTELTKVEAATNPAITETYLYSQVAGSNDFTITIPWAATQNELLNGTEDFFYASPSVIEVTYYGRLRAVANDGAQNGNTNKVTINPNSDTDDPGKEVDVYDGNITINKVDATQASKALKGAQFVIIDTDRVTDATNYLAYTEATAEEPEHYSWVASKDDALVLTTDDAGHATVSGLKAGDYYLLETVAPEGYNLMDGTQKVTLTNRVTGEGENVIDELLAEPTVTNAKGTALPSTGGIGTTLFYVIGGILVAGAAIALVVKNRVAKIEG